MIGLVSPVIAILFVFLFRRFWNYLPGKSYADKVFLWDLIRTILVYVQLFLFFFLLIPAATVFERVMDQVKNPGSNIANENDVITFLVWNAVNEFLTSDTFAWDDILFIFIHHNPGLRWILGYFVFIPLFLLIDYLWAHRNSLFAKLIRTLSFGIIIFLMFLGMISPNVNYDVYINTQLLNHWNWVWWLLVLVIIQLSTMWIGALITGYMIYKAWKEG